MLLAWPFTVACSGPVEAVDGTVATICVSLQLVTEAPEPLNVTVFEACAAWNPEPVMVTELPTPPMVGVMLAICGAGTVKLILLFPATPPSVTCTGPEGAAVGTMATICVSDQLTTPAGTRLNVSTLVPCAAPNPTPFICT